MQRDCNVMVRVTFSCFSGDREGESKDLLRMTNILTRCYIVVVLFGAGGTAGAEQLGSVTPADSKAVLAAVNERLRVLQNIWVSFSETQVFTPDPVLSQKLLGESVDTSERRYVWNNEFSFLSGSALYIERLRETLPAELKASMPSYRIRIFTPERAERFGITAAGSGGVGQIFDRDELPADNVIDNALGLRLNGSQTWTSPPDIEAMRVTNGSPGHYVLKAADKPHEEYDFSCRDGRAELDAYRFISDGKLSTEVLCDQFKIINRVSLPFHITVRGMSWSGRNMHLNTTYTISVEKYVVGAEQHQRQIHHDVAS